MEPWLSSCQAKHVLVCRVFVFTHFKLCVYPHEDLKGSRTGRFVVPRYCCIQPHRPQQVVKGSMSVVLLSLPSVAANMSGRQRGCHVLVWAAGGGRSVPWTRSSAFDVCGFGFFCRYRGRCRRCQSGELSREGGLLLLSRAVHLAAEALRQRPR